MILNFTDSCCVAGVVICLERGAQLMPLPLAVSCFSKIQIGFTFLVLAHPGSPGQRAVKRLCVCVCVLLCLTGVSVSAESGVLGLALFNSFFSA